MDYGAITSCETEYNKAVCLCGSHECRQSFMMFTGTRALDEVLRGFGPLMIFKTLIQVTAAWGQCKKNKNKVVPKKKKKRRNLLLVHLKNVVKSKFSVLIIVFVTL